MSPDTDQADESHEYATETVATIDGVEVAASIQDGPVQVAAGASDTLTVAVPTERAGSPHFPQAVLSLDDGDVRVTVDLDAAALEQLADALADDTVDE
jgi:hypothetical protein